MSGKIPVRTSRGFVREEAGEGALRGAPEGRGSAGRSHGGRGAPSRASGPGPGPPAPGPPTPKPRSPEARAALGPRPAAAHGVGRGREERARLPGRPGEPRAVKFTSGPWTVRGPRRGPPERGRARRRPGSPARGALGAPLSPWPCDPNFPHSRGAGSFRASRALGWVSAATSELGNKEGKRAGRGEERKKYAGAGRWLLRNPTT